MVVLGDPGAGKSTLLRWMATAYLLRLKSDPDWPELPDVSELPDEDWLPILVRCRDLEEPALANSLEAIVDHHLRKLGITGTETAQLNKFLLKMLLDGRAILLIDGLDEISRPAVRARFCRQVEQIHVAYPRAPIVVTSRAVGYREMGLRIGRGFEHATVLDLTPEDKDEFARRWCAVTEPAIRRENAEKELVNDIHSTDRIERLTGNPMLLTTMALVKKKVGKLPSKRADLYREAVDVLLNWRSEVDELLDPYEAMPQLEYVAYAMCSAGVQRLRADEISQLLNKMRREFPSVRAVRRHAPLEFLQLLERQTGIVVEIGKIRHKGRLVPAYEFRHLTFQEYLAGLALVEGRFPGRDRKRSLAENVSPLAANTSEAEAGDIAVSENWREALRLCVMSCNDDDVDSVLLAIADVREGEPASVTTRPRAILALSCLSDEPNVSEDVAVHLIERFIDVIGPGDGDLGRTAASRALAEVGGSLWGPILAQQLVREWISRPDGSAELGSCTATVVDKIVPEENAEYAAWLLETKRQLSSEDDVGRIYAALSVMVVAFGCRTGPRGVPGAMLLKVRPELMQLLTRPGRVAEAAAWAIGWLAGASDRIPGSQVFSLTAKQVSAVKSCIKNSATSVLTASFLLWSLSDDCSEDKKLADAVAAHISKGFKDIDSLVDEYARLFPGYADPIVLLLGNNKAPVRSVAAGILGRIEQSEAVEPLLGVLADPDDQVRNTVAEALGQIGDARAVDPLLGVLADPDGQVRNTVAEALGQIGDARAVEPLIGALTGPDGEIQGAVAQALGQIGDARAVKALQGLLNGNSRNIREQVLWALAVEESDYDRILLSRDADGLTPGIDPMQEITLSMAERYAAVTELELSEVCRRYENLQAKYLLKLEWQGA